MKPLQEDEKSIGKLWEIIENKAIKQSTWSLGGRKFDINGTRNNGFEKNSSSSKYKLNFPSYFKILVHILFRSR